LIEKTVESLIGAKKVVIHMYNSTSPAQRKYVFGKSKEEIIAVAVKGAQMIKDRLHRLTAGGTQVTLQYSPESFSATEVEFAKEISEAVMDVWQPTPQHKMILNLPDTVEVCMPNVYADQIEWICTNIKNRDSLIVSLHTHNDRGTGTAATELGLLAGADRVEGTLFGNGERTGNLDIVQVAMNLYMHGIAPEAGLQRHEQPHPHVRAHHRHDRAAASALQRRTRLHRLQRQPSGRHQEGPRRLRAAQNHLGCALPHHRPERHRPRIPRGHPRELAERQRRRRLPARKRIRHRAAEGHAARVRPHRQRHRR
jgi:hypothetical protein